MTDKAAVNSFSVSGSVVGTTAQINPWAPISRIAERLGVRPLEGRQHRATLVVSGAATLPMDGSGRAPTYDVFEVVEVFLDRIDRT